MNGLTGPIPPELARLSRLEQLGLGGNRFGGEIPSWLLRLTNLRVLHLPSNQFTGQIPSWIGDLRLSGLYLTDNQLSGPIPSELGNLTGLGALYLGGNSLTGCIPDELRDVPDNDFAETGLPFCDDPQEATDRAALVALYNATDGPNWSTSANWLSDRPLGEWYGVTTDGNGRISILILDENNLSGQIPSELGNLTNLKDMRLHENNLSGQIPSELGNLTSLENLSSTTTT